MPEDSAPPPPERWDRRYREGTARWDLGGPPPALLELISVLPGPGLRVLVPGAGNGHDALAFARAGHDVTAVDFAPTAAARAGAAAEEADLPVRVVVGDVLDLPPELRASFDLVWEHTCFCAIDPSDRDAYVASMAGVLVPDGRLYGLFWNHGEEGGPPFDIPPAEVRNRFSGRFSILSVVPVADSAGGRTREFLTAMRLRGGPPGREAR